MAPATRRTALRLDRPQGLLLLVALALVIDRGMRHLAHRRRRGSVAQLKELTVMFCDMRGFTALCEQLDPRQLQHLLAGLFTELTDVIRVHRGTIDKYIGDCVMAFWGAPHALPDHAACAVRAALALAATVGPINAAHRARGLPPIDLGIGLATGPMCVGDMGSRLRRTYTVIGDTVNLASRLETLSKVYGVTIVANEGTRLATPGCAWQELDRVRVRGKAQAVAIFTPRPDAFDCGDEMQRWPAFLQAYRAQDWAACEPLLQDLLRLHPGHGLYGLYADRVAERRQRPPDPAWDGVHTFECK